MRTSNREALQKHQLQRLNGLLAQVLPDNQFYTNKFGPLRKLDSLQEWSEFPLTSKHELIAVDGTDFARNHTYSLSNYTRLHRTSGTHGRPMIVMDTSTDWKWWLDTWQYVWDAVGVQTGDTIFMAFSFGPFIGFWSAFEAAMQRGVKAVPGGGLSTAARLDLMRASRSNVVCCTPTYAMHMAEEAQKQSISLPELHIKSIMVAGEPGGSIPSVRKVIEDTWQSRVVDHAGATEVGPWGFGSSDGKDLFVIESEFIPEFVPLNNPYFVETDGQSVQAYELVLTSLGRAGVPALRYRTGDVVCPDYSATEECKFVRLRGGILGRADDMLIIRGVNVFPSSIESILRSIPSVTEYRLIAEKSGAMDQLTVEVECNDHGSRMIADRFLVQLGLRIEVVERAPGSLPRFEGKAQRFIDRRNAHTGSTA